MSENHYKILVDNALSIIMRFDKDGRVTFFNAYAQELFGFTNDEIIGKTIWETIVPLKESTGRDLFTLLEEVIEETGKYAFNENENVKKNGDRVWIEWRNSFIQNEEGEKEILSVGMDITEKKRNEVVLREAKEEAEEATKLKDKFVSLVAHDLKAPFNSMLGMLRIVQESSDKALSDKNRETVKNVVKTGENLVEMIDKLLEISWLQTGKIVPRNKFVDAYEVCVNAIGMVSQIALEKGVEIVNKVPMNTRIFVDQLLLGQVMQNLISNAIKFSNKDNKVTIFMSPDQDSTIAVQDTGIGINKERAADIFKHEVQTSTAGTAGESGSGLGLPLSSDIVKAHNGAIRVESVEGEGSTFFLELPYTRPKVLIVNDTESFRQEQKNKLDEINVQVYEAESGDRAMEIIKEVVPDLVLIDILTPLMDGYEWVRHLKGNLITKTIPVIVVSEETEKEVREKSFHAGADDFVPSPINPDNFIPRVRRFVG